MSIRPAVISPQRTQFAVSPSPQFGFLCDCTHAAVHITSRIVYCRARVLCAPRCVRFPSVLLSPCFICVPCRVFRAFSFYSHSLLPTPALRSPARSFPSSPCVQYCCVPTDYVSAASPRAPVQYSTLHLCCRCHVTHTNWSRALAASSVVAQDTHTPPSHIHIHSCRGQLTI